MSKILVTGANGFIGSALMNRLQSHGLESIPYTRSNGDISDYFSIDANVSHVFHMAAKTSPPESWNNPQDYYRTNVQGTLQVLEYCRKNNCGITFMSTYVYGKPQSPMVDESHPINAISPYHHSKVLAEDLCRYYADNYGVSVTILRPFNIYGPNQNDNFIIPTIAKQILDPAIEVVEVLDLVPKRDYVYIDDLVDVLMLTMGRSGLSTYNVASGVSTSVEELIVNIMEITRMNKTYRSKEVQRRNEVLDIVADIRKITTELGWVPRYSIHSGLSLTIAKMKSG